MLEHALQAAECARAADEPAAVTLACLLHDVGNTLPARDAWRAKTGDEPPLLMSPKNEPIGYAKHSDMGGVFLEHVGFAPEVASAVALHVSAKRALVTIEPSYMNELSQASIDTLHHQGGPLSPSALAEFRSHPGSGVALRLRRYDDKAKHPGQDVPRLETYEDMIYEHLRAQSMMRVER